jgi:hypothetical protein
MADLRQLLGSVKMDMAQHFREGAELSDLVALSVLEAAAGKFRTLEELLNHLEQGPSAQKEGEANSLPR